jgi:hypothetical protein
MPAAQSQLPPTWCSYASGARWSPQLISCVNCGLGGALPSGWDLASLEVLFLQGNQLTGGALGVIAGSSALLTLNLSSNALAESLSEAWPFNALPYLGSLDLSHNPLGGYVPMCERARWLGPLAAYMCPAWLLPWDLL